VLGREFEVYDKEDHLLYKIKQRPISIPTMRILLEELDKDFKRQEKEMKKAKRGKK
jgi:hypothetical protein